MRITMLGTGNAAVTDCFSTCFVLEDKGRRVVVDGGGGNGILRQLKQAKISLADIHHVFVTHKHLDHLLGVVWMTRMICALMDHDRYEGEAYIYSHAEVLRLLRSITGELVRAQETRFIGERVHLVEIHDGDTLDLIGHSTTFFDIGSTKTTQYGFSMDIDGGRRLVCCGDEPLKPRGEKYARDADWLLHEAFCLYSQADFFEPYEKHHSTVRDACEHAELMGVKNLLLYHTEDRNLARRKELYAEEGRRYFSGRLWIPNDLESIEL